MQAHFINNRSMEIFRPLEGLANEIAAYSPPLAEWRKFVYCESLTGRVFGQVDHFQVSLIKTLSPHASTCTAVALHAVLQRIAQSASPDWMCTLRHIKTQGSTRHATCLYSVCGRKGQVNTVLLIERLHVALGGRTEAKPMQGSTL